MYDSEMEKIQKMLDEIEVSSSEDEESVGGDVPASDSEGEEDCLEEDLHIPDSDCYESDPDDLPDQPQKKKTKIDGWKGKDKTIWWKKNVPKMLGCPHFSNVIEFTPGLKGPAVNASSPEDFWGVFITPEIIGLLVEYTNSKIAMQKGKYTQPYRTKDTDLVEMKALIGLLMLAGTYRASRLHLADIWKADGTGIEVFRLTMSLDRFHFLLCCIQFDDKATREERKKVDKLAPVRQIFEMVVENCKKNYTPSEFVTIDEMLVAFRGHCPFRQYIPSKPAKYGIKIHALCDAKTFYICNMEIYAGIQPDGPYKADKKYNSSQAIVTRLISDISGSARNVTFDNWYTSYPLVESLLRDHKLTAVGTLRKNKKEIPPEFLVTKNRPHEDSMFGFGDNLTLVSYIPKNKKKKNVVLLSSMHHDDKIDQATGDDKKPEIITFYNSTKGGVDVIDMMMDKYSVSRNSRRWPLTVFFALLNIICVNSYVLYAHNQQNKLKRHKFIKKVSMMLLEDTLKMRLQNMCLPKGLRTEIARLFPEVTDETSSTRSQSLQCQAKRCVFCARSKDRKVKTVCSTCGKYVCRDHSKMTVSCIDCENAALSVESYVRFMSQYEERQLMRQLDRMLAVGSLPPHLYYLRRKLHVRLAKREHRLPIFSIDAELASIEQQGRLMTRLERIQQQEALSSKEMNGVRVLDRFQVPSCKSQKVGETSSEFLVKLIGQTQSNAFIHSPYTLRKLKPFIRRDYESTPPKLHLLNEIIAYPHRNDPDWKPPPRHPIDYCYVTTKHIAAMNVLARQFFWPGIDLTEVLNYPDYTCVVLYRKLVIGFGILVPDTNINEAYISFLLVNPEWRRAGIATFIVYHLIQTCLGKDVTLHVSATNPALIMYQQFGFKVEEFLSDFYDKYLPEDSPECKHAMFLRLSR